MILQPISTVNVVGNPQQPVPTHTHNGIDSPKIDVGSGSGLGSFAGSSVVVGQILTTDATPTSDTLFTLNLGFQIALIDLFVIARRTGGSAGATGDMAGFKRTGTFKRISSGSPSLMTMIQDTHSHRDQSTWDADLVVTSTAIEVQVQGAANNNITWDYQAFILYNV